MEIISYIDFKRQLKHFLNKVSNSQKPLVITNADGEDVIVISKAEYDSMEETFYLLKSPNNAMRLLKGIEEYERSKA